MVKLDKLTLSVPCNLIEDYRRAYNSKNTRLPYHLIIAYCNGFRNYIIEFSAKILGDRYPELINSDNVRDCLNKINELGVCNLNVEGILREAKVIGADFTKDILFEDIPNVNDMPNLKSVIRCNR